MLVRRFLAWAQTAGVGVRAQATAALARAYLQSETGDCAMDAPAEDSGIAMRGLGGEERIEAEIVLTAMLDDPSPEVRRAMAQVFANSAFAPRHIISALANDQSDVSAVVLNRSPLLGEAELIECASVADGYGQAAIALRPGLPGRVADALADFVQREALVALAVNETAALSEAAILRMLERYGSDGELREALLMRVDLPYSVRCALVQETASALADFAVSTGWMSPERAARATREARESAVIEIAAQAADRSAGAALEVARHLRKASLLTPAALLRSLLSGNRTLLVAALSELTGQPHGRALALANAWSGPGFAALYERAGMPASLLPAFRAAMAAQDEYGLIYETGQRPALSHILVGRTLKTLQSLQIPDFASVIGMLQRLAGEAARAEARRVSDSMRVDSLAPPVRPVEVDMDLLAAEIAVAA